MGSRGWSIMGLYIAAIRPNGWVGKIHWQYKAGGRQLETLDINEESHSQLALVQILKLENLHSKSFLTALQWRTEVKKRRMTQGRARGEGVGWGARGWLLTHFCAISDIHQNLSWAGLDPRATLLPQLLSSSSQKYSLGLQGPWSIVWHGERGFKMVRDGRRWSEIAWDGLHCWWYHYFKI